jgi:hypothetical protein
MWTRVAGWFDRNATSITLVFLPDEGAEPLAAYGGYVRLWLVEGFLAKAASWGNNHFPALHGGLAVRFLGAEATPFTTFARPPDIWTAPGVRLDYPVTPLLPFNGGVVEAEAALYRASVNGPLGTAARLIGSLSSLVGPPLSTAVAVADKVSSALDEVLEESGDQPVLALHWAATSAGGANPLRSGHLVVVDAPAGSLDRNLAIVDGRLHAGGSQLDSVDFLVLRLECRTERDDWRFPELDQLIRLAGSEFLDGRMDGFRARRTEAVSRAWNSADLVPADRRRVAKLVADEIDAVTELGAMPAPSSTLQAAAAHRLLSPDAPELEGLTLARLIA